MSEFGFMNHRIPPLDTPILVTGAGGFIGGWLVDSLIREGFSDVRAVDIKPVATWHQVRREVENEVADLRDIDECRRTVAGREHVFNFAADMGGMGFIESHRSECMISSLINTHLLMSSRESEVSRYFFASSACVYNADFQNSTEGLPLSEDMAYPAMPEDGYGWEKLFGERMLRNFSEDFGIESRVARFHNVYGPHGTWQGGREKAPAAIARKVAEAVLGESHEIEIWGDGAQTRSFTYISDAIEGTKRLMWSDYSEPLNIGSSEMVSINELVSVTEEIAGVRLRRRYVSDAPQGVRGRNSDNTRIEQELSWAPRTSLRSGMTPTYHWILGKLGESRLSSDI